MGQGARPRGLAENRPKHQGDYTGATEGAHKNTAVKSCGAFVALEYEQEKTGDLSVRVGR